MWKNLNVPNTVTKQRVHLLEIPSPYSEILPPPLSASIITLLDTAIPFFAGQDNGIQEPLLAFSKEEPELIDPDILCFHSICSLNYQIVLERQFGQEWFDGKQSLYSIKVNQWLPFWVLSFFACAQKVQLIQRAWDNAQCWLFQPASDYSLKPLLVSQIEQSWTQISWTSSIPGL